MESKKNTSSPINELIEDVIPIVPFIGRWVLTFAVDLGVAIVYPYQLYRANTLNESVFVLVTRVLLTLIRNPIQLVLTVGAQLLNALASLINNVFGLSDERALSSDELDYLKPIFGKSVDYDAIRIQSGGVKESLRISPQAVGNDIFMRQYWGTPIIEADGTLSRAGLRLLGHEVAHVWQYQNTGAGYIGDSLMTQVLDVVGRKIDLPLSDGYNLHTAVKEQRSIDECNVEQQAVMAELIGLALCESDCGSLSRESFDKMSGYDLSEEEFACVLDARTWFEQAGCRQQHTANTEEL